MLRTGLWLVLLSLALGPAFAQEKPRGKKPVLIRADQPTEDVEPEIILPDPIRAKENIEVGDFYLKKGNLAAAKERYSESIKYAPRDPEPYFRLIRVLEKMELLEDAQQVCRDFVDRNPGSKKTEDFKKKEQELARKIGS